MLSPFAPSSLSLTTNSWYFVHCVKINYSHSSLVDFQLSRLGRLHFLRSNSGMSPLFFECCLITARTTSSRFASAFPAQLLNLPGSFWQHSQSKLWSPGVLLVSEKPCSYVLSVEKASSYATMKSQEFHTDMIVSK